LNTEVGVFQPTGVTDSGVILGIDCAFTLWGNECFSILVTNVVAVDVSFPGSVQTNPYCINSKGDVVGWYFDVNYVQHDSSSAA
jgi:hypothetical protein